MVHWFTLHHITFHNAVLNCVALSAHELIFHDMTSILGTHTQYYRKYGWHRSKCFFYLRSFGNQRSKWKAALANACEPHLVVIWRARNESVLHRVNCQSPHALPCPGKTKTQTHALSLAKNGKDKRKKTHQMESCWWMPNFVMRDDLRLKLVIGQCHLRTKMKLRTGTIVRERGEKNGLNPFG